MAKDKGNKGTGGDSGRPASQQRGKGTGPDLSKLKPASKEELDKELGKWREDIDNEPFSPHEMGRNYPVQEDGQ